MMKVLAAVAMVTVSFSNLAMAQNVSLKADEVIAGRQGGMALAGGTTEAMKAWVQAGADVKPLAASAAALVEWGGAFPALFPDGTQTGHDTKAKAEVWSDRAGFEKAAAAFVAAAEKLTEAAKANDKAAFAVAFTATGQTCGACHRSYRNR